MMFPFDQKFNVKIRFGGFTLIELMVVLLLVAIISSMVFLSVSSGFFKSEERRFVAKFDSILKHCRNMAIGKGRSVNFVIDGNKRVFGIKDKKKEEIPKSIEVTGEALLELEEGIYAIIFYPDGSSSGGEIELNWESGRKDIFKIGSIFAQIRHEILGNESI